MRRARGFTLVEVLLATTLLAAGMALAFATLRNTTQATARAEELAQRGERLRAVQGFLRRQWQGALALPWEIDEATGEGTVFRATARELWLVAPMPGYLSRGGPHLQVFRLERRAGGEVLVFEHRLLTPDGALPAEREPEVLLEGIAEARFQVRGLGPDGQPGPWREAWDAPGQLPRLVRLQLRFTDPRGRWPELVAAPRLGAVGGGGLRPGPIPLPDDGLPPPARAD